MKLVFFFVLMFTSASTAHAALSAEIFWSCPTGQYDDSKIATFPSKADIQVQISFKGSGKLSYAFEPNIFEEQGGFFSGSSDYVTDASECLKQFQKNFQSWLIKNNDLLCEQDKSLCRSNEAAKSGFSKSLDSQDLVEMIAKGKTVPRFYSGHRFSMVNESKAKEELDKLCSNGPYDAAVITSRDFLDHVSSAVDNPLTDLSGDCLAKVSQINDKHEASPCKGGGFCSKMKADINHYNMRYKDLKERRLKALARSREDDKNFNPYRLAGPETKKKIKETIADPDLKNGANGVNDRFQSSGYSDNFMYYDDAISEAMPEILEKDRDFQKAFLQDYVNSKFYNQDPLETDYCSRNPCKNIKQAKKLFEQNTQTMMTSLYGNHGSEVAGACMNVDEMKKDNIRIEDLLTDIENITSCSEIKKGEIKVVDGTVTSTPSAYALTRVDDKNLKATIAINFIDGKHGTKVSSKEMFKNVKSCLATTSTYFRSPSGETINVEIISDEQNRARPEGTSPETQEIEIMPSNHRANSKAYDEDISCDTMTHEVLHLMGLCDEYKEKTKKLYVDPESGKILNGAQSKLRALAEKGKAKEDGGKYQCRSVATVDSIMATQRDVMTPAMGSSAICECKSDSCLEAIKRSDDKIRRMLFMDYTSALKAYQFCDIRPKGEARIKKVSELEKYDDAKMISESSSSFKFSMIDIQSDTSSASMAYVFSREYSCSCSSDKCKKDFNELKRRVKQKDPRPNGGCPPYIGAEMVDKKDLKYGESLENGIKIEGNKIIVNSKAERPGMSMLHPAHFTRIKYGTCPDKAKTYTKCMRYAYKDKGQCPDRPAACKDVNKWLLSDK